MRERPRLGTVALLAGGLAGSLLLGELALRAADAADLIRPWSEWRQARASSIWMASENPALIYRHRPGYEKGGTRHTERHGILRPHDAPPRAADGSVRIVALGDSVIAALKLDYEQRMLTRLQATLSAGAGRPVEVLNFGVNGYDTLQEAALLETLAAGFHPDLVVLQYCVNDFHPTRYPSRRFLPRHRSRLLAFAQLWRDPLLDGYPPAAYWEELYRSDAQGWDAVRRGFARIAGYARERGIPALLVIVPVLSHEGWWVGDAAGRHRRVAELGRAAGFEVLDLLPVCAGYPVETLRFEPWDTFHLNALGHRVAAEAMAAKLREMGVPQPASVSNPSRQPVLRR